MANPIKYSDLVQSDDSISKLIEQLKLAIETYAKMKSSVSTDAKAIQSALKGVNSTTAEGREKIAALSSAAEELASRRKEITAADKQARAALDQLVTVQERSWRGYVNIDNAIKSVMSRNYDAYIKRNEAGMVSYAASIDQASRDLTRLSTAHQQLDDDLSHGRITVEVYEAQLRGVQDAAAKAQTSLDSMISAAGNSGSGAGMISRRSSAFPMRRCSSSLFTIRRLNLLYPSYDLSSRSSTRITRQVRCLRSRT